MTLDVKFQTGLLWQDTQHTEWISLLNKLELSINEKQDAVLFNQAISFLVMYVNHHFGIEEEYMKKYDYAEKRFHMEEHRLYIMRLKDFREKYKQQSDEAFIDIIKSMKEWIFSHIMENDKKLGKFILEIEQKQRSNS